MKYLLLFCVLAFSTSLAAVSPKLYRCVQADGNVVIQDRRCMVTDLQQAKPKQPNKRVLSSPKTQAQQFTQPRNQVKRPGQAALQRSAQKSLRSPYFTFGWDRFIPANWVMLKINTASYEQLLLSRHPFKNHSQFEQGVKFSVYKNTTVTTGRGAFAQALQLYHQVRDNSTYRLLDSQFKNHTKYKVFNIKYQNNKQQILLTEFYIDEAHNDLFVVTVQANEAYWQTNWQLAENMISRL